MAIGRGHIGVLDVEIFLEYYPGMAERELERITREAQERWSLTDCLIIHRVGKIRPGETIVLSAA